MKIYRTIKGTILLLIFTLFLFSPSYAQSREQIITAIEINGNKLISSEQIFATILTQIGDILIEEKINNDLKAIYALGYFSDVKTDTKPYREGVKIIFEVTENPAIKEIAFSGVSVYTAQEIQAVIETKAGELLNYKSLREDIKKIDQLYHDDGYMLARIIDVSTDAETAILTINVIEGIVEAIALEGNKATRDYVILRELETEIRKPLNEKILAKDMRRVFNLGFFSDISPRFEPGSAPDTIILIIKVKETRTGTINFGGGYGEREGWFGFTDINFDNLAGTGQGLLLRGQFGQEQSIYQLRYFYPWFFPDQLGKRVSFTMRRWYTFGRDIFITQQDQINNGWSTTFRKPFTEVFSTSLSLGSELVTPYGTSTFNPYTSNTLGITLAYDTRDFWLNPSEGAYYTFSLKQGWKISTLTTQFTKYTPDINQFIKLADRQTLALHLGLGVGLGDVPSSEYYWAGGPNTVRGYFPSEIRYGTRKFIVNIEYRHTFTEIFQGVIFFDWGDVVMAGAPDFANMYTGKGFGLRLNTPLGPIRLDYGIAGGKDWGEGVTHFSIGHAF